MTRITALLVSLSLGAAGGCSRLGHQTATASAVNDASPPADGLSSPVRLASTDELAANAGVGGRGGAGAPGSPGGAAGGCPPGAPCPPAGPATFVVDATRSPRPISPAIYGVAFADKRTLEVATVHRFGGDCTSMYNWKTDAFNCGADWQFANQAVKGFGYPPFNDTDIPAGVTGVDHMVRTTRAAGVDVLLTVPTLGWVARDHEGKGDSSGHHPELDAVRANPEFMQQWVQHLVTTFGSASSGGVKYYQLDNEPDNWAKMHADVHPKPASAAELWAGWEAYARAIKAADPAAYVLAYSPATLEALVYSPLDETSFGVDEPEGSPLDRKQQVVKPISAWLLKQAAAAEKRTGKRLIDCLDLHYPTAGSNPVADTRSLWDPSYDEKSWLTQYCFHGPIDLLPRMQQWIDANYPGTGICISEYTYYGGKDGTADTQADPHAGVVEADALGAFGKYGVKLAAYWTLLTDSKGNPAPPYNAFAMYRNYDGRGGHFGDVSVGASSRLSDVAIYAATDSLSAPTRLWVMLINKGDRPQDGLGLDLEHFSAGATAAMYRSVGVVTPQAAASVPVARNSLTVSLPPLSINLLVITKA